MTTTMNGAPSPGSQPVANALAVPTDVSKEDDIRRLIDTAVDRYGRLEAAFNNAGILGNFAPIPDDAGDVAVWLASDEARFVTGQSILVDGGYTIAGLR